MLTTSWGWGSENLSKHHSLVVNHKVVKVLITKINTTLINNKIKGKWSQSLLNVTIIINVLGMVMSSNHLLVRALLWIQLLVWCLLLKPCSLLIEHHIPTVEYLLSVSVVQPVPFGCGPIPQHPVFPAFGVEFSSFITRNMRVGITPQNPEITHIWLLP